jgi:class 3 adenylate cyclase/predicted ATPase
MQPASEKAYFFEGYTLDLRRGCLRSADHEIELRPKSFEMLRNLVENAGRLISKDELAKVVWPNVAVTDESLTRCMSEVRLALGDRGQRLIKTVPRRGYLLAAPVSEAPANAGLARDAAAASPLTRPPTFGEAPSNLMSQDESRPHRSQPNQTCFERPPERRQLTVMACELVSLAALSTRIDPEDLGRITAACHRHCTEIIERCHGYVARYLDDGLLAYFGYPVAYENDAENAIRTGLALVGSATHLSVGLNVRLQLRIGVASGIVVIGATHARTAVGETPNLARRLQSIANAGCVVVARSTCQMVGGLFEYRDLGLVAVDGFAEPVSAFEVLGTSTVESRFDARRGTRLLPLVGREEELELLQRRWTQAREGEGRVILVSGEPGIGKSRLTVALQELLQTESQCTIRYFCSPHHTDSPLFPVISQIERAAGFERTDDPARRLAKLKSVLKRSTSQVKDELSLLVDLLSLPIHGRGCAPEMSPQRRREKTLAALLGQVESLARQRPVLLVYEDVHWIDPTTRELLEISIERVAQLPVLLVITFRPEFQPSCVGQVHVTLLTLNRLRRRDGEALVEHVADRNALSEEVVAALAQHADGIPLFIEELTKAVLELRNGERDEPVSTALLPMLAVPATLQASLLARIDRLAASAREVSQTAAAIGREFSYKLLAVVSGYGLAPLTQALRELEAAGLIYARGTPPDAIYKFKHALVQEAAYSTLLRERRRVLHAEIVDALEISSGDMVVTQPERMAQHCAAAGLVERAVMYWRKAGQLAISRFALAEAIAHLTKALRLLHELPETEEHKKQELGLQIALGEAFIAAKGHGAGETGQAFARAYELGRQIGGAPQLFHVLAGMFVHHHVRAEVDREQGAARELLRLAEEQGDVAGQVMAHRALGDSLLNLGRFSSAHTHLERALSLFGPDASPVIVGEEIGVAALAFLSLCLVVRGFPAEAAARSEKALERARHRVRHPHTLAFALNVDSRLQWVLRDPQRLKESSDELFSLAVEHNLTYMRAQGTIYRGGVLALAGRFAEAASLLEEGVAGVQATGAVWLLPFNGGALASAYQQIGRIEEARSALDKAMESMRITHIEWVKAELQRIQADLALSAPVPDPGLAEAYLRQAITTARQQSAKWWELRATTRLARLWRDQGKRNEARALVAPLSSWFTEGFDTPDFKDAMGLLDEFG